MQQGLTKLSGYVELAGLSSAEMRLTELSAGVMIITFTLMTKTLLWILEKGMREHH